MRSKIYMCEGVVCVCVFGCDVFMCVLEMHVTSVCNRLEGWKHCVSCGGGVVMQVYGAVCESMGLSKEPRCACLKKKWGRGITQRL